MLKRNAESPFPLILELQQKGRISNWTAYQKVICLVTISDCVGLLPLEILTSIFIGDLGTSLWNKIVELIGASINL